MDDAKAEKINPRTIYRNAVKQMGWPVQDFRIKFFPTGTLYIPCGYWEVMQDGTLTAIILEDGEIYSIADGESPYPERLKNHLYHTSKEAVPERLYGKDHYGTHWDN